MATTGVRFDDGSGGFASSCFPVRGLNRFSEDAGGAWLVAHKVEQRRRFKAVLCTKPRDFEQIREERKRAEKEGTAIVPPPLAYEDQDDDEDNKVLDGFFLMKHCCIDDPSDLCSMNINGQQFSEVKEEDFPLFDSVAYVNAAENFLPLRCFNSFPTLRELELPLNGLRGLKLLLGDFPNLEMLDVSYNNLSAEDILLLGLMPNLRVLHLTGNGLSSLPQDMARPHVELADGRRVQRYQSLEILMVDDNKLTDLTTFASLAGLKCLKHLNLSKNNIYSVPQLMVVEGRLVTQESEMLSGKSGRKSRSSSQRSARREARRSARLSARQAKLIEANKQMDEHFPTGPDTLENATASGANITDSSANVNVTNTQAPPEGENVIVPDANGKLVQSDSALTESTPVDGTQLAPKPSVGEPQNAKLVSSQITVNSSAISSSISDMQFGELDLDEIDEKVEKQIEEEKIEEQKSIIEEEEKKKEEEEEKSFPPPFPELRYLNLSHNRIEEEEGLLAVAAWPLLSELVIHDNPLTTQHSGDPPLLKRFLSDRLGIHLTRKNPGPLDRPHIEVPQKKGRKVKSHVPKVPKCNVDELLALEWSKQAAVEDKPSSRASKQPSRGANSRGANSRPGTQGSLRTKQTPLPPITPEPGHETGAWEERADDTETREQSQDGAFFMTQVDEPARSKPKTPQPPPPRDEKKKRKTRKPRVKDEKYKGYEELVDVDDEDIDANVPLPSDMQGSIRALQYTLNHPLIFRENVVQLDKEQKPFKPYERGVVPVGPPRKTKGERVDEALDKLKHRSVVVEAELEDVLKDKRKYRKDFKDADSLLAQVQHRYNAVRVSSMKEARTHEDPQNILNETMKVVEANS